MIYGPHRQKYYKLILITIVKSEGFILKDYHLNLSDLFNNHGILGKNEPINDSSFSLGISFYPAEYLPKYGEKFHWENTSFLFPTKTSEGFDNLTLDYQTIQVPKGKFTDLYILGSSNNGNFYDDVQLLFNNNIVYTFKLALTEFVSETSWFGDPIVLECPFTRNKNLDLFSLQPKIYCHQEQLPSNITFDEIKLGSNPFIHLFSITLRGETIE
ncbi:hypothetical protein ACFMB7_26830 [Bacillus toyonensis]